jgi:molybdate transport system substrate-binding protein
MPGSNHHRSLRFSLSLLLLALVLLATAVGAAASAGTNRRTASPQLTILAAASLVNALPAFDSTQRYSFAGSDALEGQIKLGAPADVFASASPKQAQELYALGLVEKPVVFATNRLVLGVPTSNPAGITSVFDVTKPGVKLVIGTPTVPIGAYTRQVLGQLGIRSQALANVVDQEKDVSGIVAKLALDVAQAGFIYSTDQLANSGQIQRIAIPAWAQPPVRYEIAVVAKSPNQAAAKAYVKSLTGTAGRAALHTFGFGVPKLPKPAHRKA